MSSGQELVGLTIEARMRYEILKKRGWEWTDRIQKGGENMVFAVENQQQRDNPRPIVRQKQAV